MAEAFGIAGSAVGIVSLGLQLYGGITTYFDALEGREDDLASARAQLDSLRDSLVTIQSALPAASTASTHSGTIPPIVGQCKDELDRLELLLQELAGSSNSCKKLKEKVKTLRFPFRRDILMKLEDRLHKTNSVFQTALSVFHLNKQLGNEQKLANVEAATTQIPAINTNVAQVSTELQGLRADVAQISTKTNDAATILHSNNTAVTSLADNFGAFAPEAMSRLGEVRQSLGTVARQDDMRELSRISVNNTDVLCRVDISVAQMAAKMESRAQNSASADQQILQRLSNMEQFLGLQNIERQADSKFVLQRVLAKPSQTREIFDSLSPFRAKTRHHGSSFQEAYDLSISPKFQGPSCTCLLRKSRQGSSRNFGPFWLRTETSHHGHSQSCQLAKWNFGEKRRWFELTGAGRSTFWSWAVGVSFAITTGAGGLSISPNINYRPVVDEKESPVFRVLNVLGHFLGWRSDERLSQTDVSRCLGAVASMILTLYQERKAFPSEVNTNGESAVYKMVNILCDGLPFIWHQAFIKFVMWAVVEADLPANICDFRGRTPVMEIALEYSVGEDQAIQLLPILYDKAPESVVNPDMLNNWARYEHRFSSEYSAISIQNSPPEYGLGRIQSEIFGYGPICTAIFAQHSEEQINDLIDTMGISEVGLFGQTALHLAVGTGNLNVLAAVLRSTRILDILHLRDVQGSHAIDYAVQDSGWCDNCEDPDLCSECYCSNALDMLLCVESCFDRYLESITDSEDFVEAMGRGSLRSRFLLMSEIKLRRDQLKQLALVHLDDEDIQRYKLDRDDVLDYHGIDVVERLTDIGVEVPTTLRNSFLKSARRRSIYHNLSQSWGPFRPERVARLIFDLGFHDTNEPDELGCTPLMLACRENVHPAVVLWFVENGADLTLRDPRTGSKTYSHAHVNPSAVQQVFNGLRSWIYFPDRQDSQRASLLTTIVPVDMTDDCKCYCTEGGCSPASMLFWKLWGIFEGNGSWLARPRKSPTEAISEIALFLETGSLDLTSHRRVCLAALRMLTFQALGIRHTCGCRDRWNSQPQFSRDEIEEAWEEDAHLIGRLEELQAEFETEIDTSGVDFSTFLTTRWLPRLMDVLTELDGCKLSEAERACAEAIGVKWHTQAEDQPSDKRVATVEDFFRALREIEKG